jgi:DNA-directed RNA polymerase specialized sigma24 family protein
VADSSFDRTLDGLAARDPAAAERVFRETFARMVRLVGARLGDRYRAKVDPEEVANSALNSFFRRHAAAPYDLADWHDVRALLTEIALCKLSNELRRYSRRARDAGRERPTHDIDLPAAGPGPDVEVVLADLLDRLMAGWSAEERAVIEMSVQGYAVAEVAVELGWSERTVIRVRKRFQDRLTAEHDRDADPA